MLSYAKRALLKVLVSKYRELGIFAKLYALWWIVF
jgi:hypothetical protein